ncbi:MAG TPA: M67 family metallopeptidase [Anaerolineaceae bacterium]
MSDPQILVVPRSIWEEMRKQVSRLAPEEACGMLAGRAAAVDRVLPVTNRVHSPSRFEMDPQEQVNAFLEIEAAGLDLLAIYHSHPLGPPFPSPTDQEEFLYPGVLYLIWSPAGAHREGWGARMFSLDGGTVGAVAVEVR